MSCPLSEKPAAVAVDNGRLVRWRRAGRKSPTSTLGLVGGTAPGFWAGVRHGFRCNATFFNHLFVSLSQGLRHRNATGFFPTSPARGVRAGSGWGCKGVRCGEANLAGG
jgi:hypothetical protein